MRYRPDFALWHGRLSVCRQPPLQEEVWFLDMIKFISPAAMMVSGL